MCVAGVGVGYNNCMCGVTGYMCVDSQDTCVWSHRIHVCGVTGYIFVESVDLCGGTDCVCIHRMYAGSLDMSGVTGCVWYGA